MLTQPTPRTDIRLKAALSALLACLCVASLATGPAHLSIGELVQGLLQGEGVAGIIIRDIRLPRLLLSLGVGASLGLCGAALQGLLRNPLAEPAIFGAPQAAAFGAVATLYSGLANAVSWALPAAAILGAALSVALVLVAAGRRAGIITLILAGLAVGSLAGAAISLAINLSANPFAVTEIIFWLMGSFEDRSMQHVALAAPCLMISSLILLRCGPSLRLLTLGDDTARSLGLNVTHLRLWIVTAVAIGVGGGVAVSGAIGFVGLIAPHLMRPLVGGDPQRVLVPSSLAAAALLTAADIGVRLIPATSEIKIGVVTSLIGVPLFLWLVWTRRGLFSASDAP